MVSEAWQILNESTGLRPQGSTRRWALISRFSLTPYRQNVELQQVGAPMPEEGGLVGAVNKHTSTLKVAINTESSLLNFICLLQYLHIYEHDRIARLRFHTSQRLQIALGCNLRGHLRFALVVPVASTGNTCTQTYKTLCTENTPLSYLAEGRKLT